MASLGAGGQVVPTQKLAMNSGHDAVLSTWLPPDKVPNGASCPRHSCFLVHVSCALQPPLPQLQKSASTGQEPAYTWLPVGPDSNTPAANAVLHGSPDSEHGGQAVASPVHVSALRRHGSSVCFLGYWR